MTPELGTHQPIEIKDKTEANTLKLYVQVADQVWYHVRGSEGKLFDNQVLVARWIPRPDVGENMVGVDGRYREISHLLSELPDDQAKLEYCQTFLRRLAHSIPILEDVGLRTFIEYYSRLQPIMDRYQLPDQVSGALITYGHELYEEGEYSVPAWGEREYYKPRY